MTGSLLEISLLSEKILKQTQLCIQKEKCLFLILQYFLPCINTTHLCISLANFSAPSAIHHYYTLSCCFGKAAGVLQKRHLLTRKQQEATANAAGQVTDSFTGGASVTPNGQVPPVRLPLQEIQAMP